MSETSGPTTASGNASRCVDEGRLEGKCGSIWMEDSSVQLSGFVPERLKGRKGQDPSCIGVTGADRGCEGPHDGPPEGRVRTNPVPTSTWPDE